MHGCRKVGTAALGSVVLLSACGGGGDAPSSNSTTPAPATSAAPPATAKAPEALKAALLKAADVPGATPAATGKMVDVSPCFPGNPLGIRNNPNEVVGPDLRVVQGKVQRTYGSSATQAGPKQAAAYVATFSSPAGSSCLVRAIKSAVAAQAGPKADASALVGSVKAAAVGEGGAVLEVRGNLKANGAAVPLALDLVTFHQGPLMVLVSVSAIQGSNPGNQAVGLATRIAGRLP